MVTKRAMQKARITRNGVKREVFATRLTPEVISVIRGYSVENEMQLNEVIEMAVSELINGKRPIL